MSLNHPLVLKMQKSAAELVLTLCVLKHALILMVRRNYPSWSLRTEGLYKAVVWNCVISKIK